MKSLIIATFLLPAAAMAGQHFTGPATVTDGDTIRISGSRIRLHGIDAPESAQLCMVAGREVRCGAETTRRLAEKIAGKTIDCESHENDRYGRVVAVCFADGQDINAWMVSEGLAVAYRKYSVDYAGQEAEAKAARRGVWASDFEMPWDWRKSKKRER